ncbi:MAG: tRNA (adenine-N1)-methyltransferase [archaeon]
MAPIKKVLIDRAGRRFYIRNADEDYHCQHGLVKKEDIGKRAGSHIQTNTGVALTIFPSSFCDRYAKIKRGPQIIPRKDVGAIIAETGIGKDSVCFEAGSGSGALGIALANVVKSVVSYEVREDFHKIAKGNAEDMGLKNITHELKDIYEGIDEKNVDLLVLDLPEPWRAVQHAAKAIKPGGFFVSYSPTTPQVSDFVQAVEESGDFIILKTIELIEREWEVDGRKVRPRSQAIGHSGFMTFCRRA